MGDRSYLSIGDVLALLRDEFPDITISKIRFLESRGLLVPERTPSGYRKFYDHDVERLRWILRQQREHFLPLKVIKGRLDGASGAAEPESLFDPAEAPPAAVLAHGGGASNGSSHPSRSHPSAHDGEDDDHEHRATVATIVRTEERSDVDFGDYEPDDSTDEADLDDLIGVPAEATTSVPAPAPAPAPAPELSSLPSPSYERQAGYANGRDAVHSVRPAAFAGGTSPARGLSATATAILTQSAAGGSAEPAAQSRATARVGTAGSVAGRPATADGERFASTGATAPPVAGESAGDTQAAEHTQHTQHTQHTGAAESVASLVEPPPAARPTAARPTTDHDSVAAPAASAAGTAPMTPDPAPAATSASEPATGRSASTPSASIAATVAARRSASAMSGTSMTAGELAQASGLSVGEIEELESFGLIEGRSVAGVHVFDEESLVMAGLAASFQRFGIEARHLRIFKHAAERQAGLYSQVVMPLLRQRNPEARARALESLQKMSELGMALQACFSRMTLRDLTGG